MHPSLKQKIRWAVTNSQSWYVSHQRNLPWRLTQDPYRIWVSEVMLQQTQVKTVLGFYDRFTRRFPTLEALAKAPLDDVLSHWSGLGYYSRARNLHRGALWLHKNHAGVFPKDRNQALHTPGVGPYTAGAVLSIAFNLPEPIVDGNVQRVFTRFFGIHSKLELKSTQDKIWNLARAWVEASTCPRNANQALMELGALVCTRHSPICQSCPIQDHCIAHKKNWQSKLPLRNPRKKKTNLHWAALIYQRGNQVWMTQHQNKDRGWWKGLWDLPRIEAPTPSALRNQLQPLSKNLHPLGIRKHTVTHHSIHIRVLQIKAQAPQGIGRWWPLEKALAGPISGLSRKILIPLKEC